LFEEAGYSGIEIAYHRMAIPDFSTPSIEAMHEILDLLESHLQAGRSVYVHCWGGIGRTGTVIGCYLVRNGTSRSEVLGKIADLRKRVPDRWRSSPETDEQRRMVELWKE
jgi:protein-tyrosine phosphatase